MAIEPYQQHLDEYVYEKIWTEMSKKDKAVLFAVANSDGSVKQVKSNLGMEDNQFSPYRERLLRKGVLEASGYGTVELTLPLFREYVLAHMAV